MRKVGSQHEAELQVTQTPKKKKQKTIVIIVAQSTLLTCEDRRLCRKRVDGMCQRLVGDFPGRRHGAGGRRGW